MIFVGALSLQLPYFLPLPSWPPSCFARHVCPSLLDNFVALLSSSDARLTCPLIIPTHVFLALSFGVCGAAVAFYGMRAVVPSVPIDVQVPCLTTDLNTTLGELTIPVPSACLAPIFLFFLAALGHLPTLTANNINCPFRFWVSQVGNRQELLLSEVVGPEVILVEFVRGHS